MRVKLTDIVIRSLKPGANVSDAACPGLRIRVTRKGVRSFALAFRSKTTGKTVWLTLGRYPDMALGKAREVANDARKVAANGGTPLAPLAPLAPDTAAQKKIDTYA